MVKGKEARKKLREAVRVGFWDTDEARELQEELSKKAKELIEKGYEKCVREGSEPITKCYAKVAAEAGLSKAYKDIWGKPTTA